MADCLLVQHMKVMLLGCVTAQPTIYIEPAE